MYPGMAKAARAEGFNEIADWFETLAKAEKSHAGRFESLLTDDPLRRVETQALSSRTSRRTGSATIRREQVLGSRPRWQQEVTRAFEICHGLSHVLQVLRLASRRCSTWSITCTGDVRKIDARETAKVMDACFQCKLCEVQCPYTPRDAHAFQLDFPSSCTASGATRAARGADLARQVARGSRSRGALGAAPRRPGQRDEPRVRRTAGSWRSSLGIHREKLLPDFAAQTFERWAREPASSVRARRRGRALPDLLRAEQRARSRPRRVEVFEKNRSTCAA
jgi:hypothetical protein